MTASRQPGLVARLAEAWPESRWRDSHVVLAVSGGPDSVAMLRAVLEVKNQCGGRGAIYAAHFNHGWRGVDSDADEAWLVTFCQKHGVPLDTARANTAAMAADGDGPEAAARRARYKFLTSAAERLGARYVAAGHTADDQVETVLHRIVRGTGLTGLAGMPFTRPLSPTVVLVRPLLTARRSDVIAYLEAIGQDYRTDSTNKDPRWTRSRLRHELLPFLRERFNRGVDEALLRLAGQAMETQEVVTEFAVRLASESVNVQRQSTMRKSESVCVTLQIDCGLLANRPPLLVREVCKIAWNTAGWPMQSMGFDEWRKLAELVLGEKQASITLPANIQARREGGVIYLEPTADFPLC